MVRNPWNLLFSHSKLSYYPPKCVKRVIKLFIMTHIIKY